MKHEYFISSESFHGVNVKVQRYWGKPPRDLCTATNNSNSSIKVVKGFRRRGRRKINILWNQFNWNNCNTDQHWRPNSVNAGKWQPRKQKKAFLRINRLKWSTVFFGQQHWRAFKEKHAFRTSILQRSQHRVIHVYARRFNLDHRWDKPWNENKDAECNSRELQCRFSQPGWTNTTNGIRGEQWSAVLQKTSCFWRGKSAEIEQF